VFEDSWSVLGVENFKIVFEATSFLQRVSIACYAERCISYDRCSLNTGLEHYIP